MGAVVDKLEVAWYETGVNALRGILQEDKDSTSCRRDTLLKQDGNTSCLPKPSQQWRLIERSDLDDLYYPLKWTIIITDLFAAALFMLPNLRPIIFDVLQAGKARIKTPENKIVQTTVTLYTEEQAQRVVDENQYLTWMVEKLSCKELKETPDDENEDKHSTDVKRDDAERLVTVERDIFFNESEIRKLIENRAGLLKKSEERQSDLEEYTFLYNEAECLLTVAKLEVVMLTRHIRKMMKGGNPLWVLETIPETE